MNETLKEIASRYEVAEDRIPEILEKLPVKNPEKPTKKQIQGFEKVCTLIKEGKSTEEAIDIVISEAKNGTKESSIDLLIEDEELDNFIIEQAIRAADAALSNLPKMALAERQRLTEIFIKNFRARVAQEVRKPEYYQQFDVVIESDDVGKSKLLNGSTTNMVLPSSTSGNS
ncbi:MAG: hypothetical protein HC820_08720 [Hydrococcus sp. RM1_1_31]|nr:hypothetical protein [Hydrococcus sp. RM1_1_31]